MSSAWSDPHALESLHPSQPPKTGFQNSNTAYAPHCVITSLKELVETYPITTVAASAVLGYLLNWGITKAWKDDLPEHELWD